MLPSYLKRKGKVLLKAFKAKHAEKMRKHAAHACEALNRAFLPILNHIHHRSRRNARFPSVVGYRVGTGRPRPTASWNARIRSQSCQASSTPSPRYTRPSSLIRQMPSNFFTHRRRSLAMRNGQQGIGQPTPQKRLSTGRMQVRPFEPRHARTQTRIS